MKKMIIDKEKVINELEEDDWANGDLILMIGCTKCNANFELNRDNVAMALLMNTSFIEYLKYIQCSDCPICNKKEKEDES